MIDAILILGMHRSGTSCLTGCLNNLGLNLGEVSDSNKHNLKGNQENKNVFRLNESLFRHNNGSWKNPPNPSNLNWSVELEQRRNSVLEEYCLLSKPWGIKDPRMVMAYSFWHEHLPSHLFVGTLRHPTAVAMSLAARNKIELSEGYKLWKTYNQQLLNLFKKKSFPIINFDVSGDLYLEKIILLAQKLNLEIDLNLDFFDATLKNQSNFCLSDCPNHLLSLYKELLDNCL